MHIQDLVLMSSNAGKLKEIRKVLAPCNINLLPITDYVNGALESPPENSPSFIENALTKAYFGATMSRLPSLADDSGIIVPALNDEPGVLSARYAATGNDGNKESTDNTDPAANRAKLLDRMKSLTGTCRQAYFFCVLALVRHPKDPVPLVVSGKWCGEIATQEIGELGFGYDSIFYVPELGKTAAQITMEQKNVLSHRGQALAKIISELR
ncbi:MAG: RdgB/HAM1 family non-canonical purine NTP pyrophosphatase [Gammaproteobacteria bacterium]|nr:RdgB/HAM1 family non-canonical purine NTP pyrophosphatase [Gammaproteobacteria bacterium]